MNNIINHPAWQLLTQATQITDDHQIVSPLEAWQLITSSKLWMLINPALQALAEHFGYENVMVVGGAVRDAMLGIAPTKDIDFEVYGAASAEDLIDVLQTVTDHVDVVGKSFGVIKAWVNGQDFDFNLPGRDNKTASGHKGCERIHDPTITPKEAAARRDFTWNALAFTLDGELLDFYGGVADLQAGIMRHTSPAFVEDPVRMKRGMQFSSRYLLRFAPETSRLGRELLPEAATLSKFRIWGEWAKMLDYGLRPSYGLQALMECGWLATVPELEALVGCEQNPQYHPEGDVFTHTCMAADRAAEIATREMLTVEQRRILILAAICHDLGKPETSIDDEGVIRSPGHAQKGEELTKNFLTRIGAPKGYIPQVQRLVCYHMAHIDYGGDISRVMELADLLAPANVALWAMLVEADHSARPPLPQESPVDDWIDLAWRFGCLWAPASDLIVGRDLVSIGVQPGPDIGAILRRVRAAQRNGLITTAKGALSYAHRHLGSKINLLSGDDLKQLGVQPGPLMGRILEASWEAQDDGHFKEKAGALAWAREYLRM